MDVFETYPFDLFLCLEKQEHGEYHAGPYREDCVVHYTERSHLRGRSGGQPWNKTRQTRKTGAEKVYDGVD